ncbi:hypothetical protein C6P41_002216 [Kluyveromyces marxianus]|nr:hypothetical protein C6P43_003539 [Kluyveromyces marxianus]KAG0684591.1 hypothetical protein C6P41_002216 [Kluyveromyces marxianus]
MSDCSTTVHSIRSEMDALSLKAISPSKLNRKSNMSDRYENKSTEFKLHTNIDDDEEEEESKVRSDVVSKMKNEKFHLELELEQKTHEIAKLRAMLMPKQTPPAIDLRFTTSRRDPMYYKPEKEVNPEFGDFISHFSSSSYDGIRNDINETSTVASTTSSRKEKNHMLFTRSILPFIRDSISIYQSSHVLNGEMVPIKEEFDNFYDKSLSKEERCEVLSKVLVGILRVQRLNVAALNRELEMKAVDRKMDYLAACFSDPTDYDMPKSKMMKRIRNEMLSVIISLYGELPSMTNTKPHYHVDTTQRSYKTKQILREQEPNIGQFEPEILPIGYTTSTSKPSRSKKKRVRNIKLTPFKTTSQENIDPEDDIELDLSDPLHMLLAERLSGTDMDNTSSLTNTM